MKWVSLSLVVALQVASRLALESDKVPLELLEVVSGALDARGFDGSWISPDEYLRTEDAVVVYSVRGGGGETTTTLLGAEVLADLRPCSVVLSADRTHVVVGFDGERGFRHSSSARFTAISVADRGATRTPLGDGERLQLFRWAPRADAAVFVRDNDVYYLANATATPVRLTGDGRPGVLYNGVPDWVYEEEVLGSGSALWFSPEGTGLAYASFDDSPVEEMTYSLYGEGRQYPAPVTLRYPKAGTPNPRVTLHVVDLLRPDAAATELPPPTAVVGEDALLLTVTWADDASVVAQWANRVQNVVQTSRYSRDAAWGASQGLRLTAPGGWLTPPEPVFVDGHTYLTVASHENFPHLTLVRDGVASPVTGGDFEVTDVYGVARDGVTAFFRATEAGFPSRRQVFSTPLTGAAAGTLTCLSCDLTSPENRTCLHASAAFSEDLSHVVLTCAGPDPTVATLHSTGAGAARVLEANEDLRAKLRTRQVPELLDDRVGAAQVRLWLPPGLDRGGADKRPTVVFVYAGPGSQQVSDAFQLGWGAYLVTNRRYVYAMVDGRGSGFKGDDNLFAVNRRLGSVEVRDQLDVARALGRRFPFVDVARTGVWGWSYGGYAAATALALDDGVFRCGVAVAPVTSWRFYDSVYTERYMGLPEDNPGGYDDADVTRLAGNFRNHSFLVLHGSGDDNVHLQNSLLLARALEDRGVLFGQNVYADESHGLSHVLPHVYVTMDDFWERCFTVPSGAAATTLSLCLSSLLLVLVPLLSL